jgi:hypothetical protein
MEPKLQTTGYQAALTGRLLQDYRVNTSKGSVFNEETAKLRGTVKIMVFIIDNDSGGRTIESGLLHCSIPVLVHKRSQA